MDASDRPGPCWWSTTSTAELDRLAHGVLEAARNADSELRREPPDPARRAQALRILAGQTKAMLRPATPDDPPLGTAAQEGFVRTSLALALHVRAHNWAEADLGAVGVPGQEDVPHPGERLAADAFDVLGRLTLPHASPEGWTAALVTDLARGDETLEAAVKLGKYALHPTPLGIVDDVTRLTGKALHDHDVLVLRELARSLLSYAWNLEPGTDLAAALVEDLLEWSTPVADEQATVLKPREEVRPDELSEAGAERQQGVQPGSTSFTLQKFASLEAQQGPAWVAPDTDDSGPDGLRGV